mmetsp:Transcript_7985/g.15241  ORF Transcript_7985/g.15241 Transcript_7985/m.15241 type:complete len:1712 (+) Transcript_7985:39-5174(+)|eukprot:CAMPEP_0175140878 /NCGR_PEP_ID=MMETSP0087-20121206/11767_1 /TAXON_ID=136419 /ORGANISM="Unknown Unknown, Strain D1" /LENGTH=1711 /DNA_ID=CAMNT_0016424177 /DNA_START=39 /DNA_END=5174 /DNA_ORIENTATION=+
MASPISAKDILSLTEKQIDQSSIMFKNVTLQSSKYICVREEGKNSVAVIDTNTKSVMNLPIQVDNAIMNPISKVLALRAGNNLQIYNLEMKTKMKSTVINDGSVVFWKWIDAKTIAIVTERCVLHWSMDGEQQPQKIFDRAQQQGQVQIINYRSSADGKWLALGGIAADPNGGVKGVLQVYSVTNGSSQPTMDAHAACFTTLTVDGRSTPSTLFCFTKIDQSGSKLMIIEVGADKSNAFNVQGQMRMQPGDFPVGMLPDKTMGVLFVLTKGGFLFVHEVQSGKCIFGQQVSKATMFAQIESDESDGGIIAVDQTGLVKQFAVNRSTVVNHVCNQLNDFDLGVAMAKRYNLPGAEGHLGQQFTNLMQQGQHQAAMELAATSPQGILRTAETINALKAVNNGQAVLQYFQLLLGRGSLNKLESIELARPVLQRQGQGLEHIKGWLKENKLEASEDLGDLLKNHNVTLALSVYLRAKVPEKVIGCFLQLSAQEHDDHKATEHLNNILAYAAKVSFAPNYNLLIEQLSGANPDRAKDFALLLIGHQDGPKVDVNAVVDSFMRRQDVKNTTNILLEYLKPRNDLDEDAALQTKLLEINLLQAPKVAEAILDSDEYNFTKYDRNHIAKFCERAQLFTKALEHYDEDVDIKRVLNNSGGMNPAFLMEWFSGKDAEKILEYLRHMLTYNLQGNIRIVVEVAKRVSGEKVAPINLIQLFEEFKSFHGVYFFLQPIVMQSEDSSLVFKYIEAAVKLKQNQVLQDVCREHNHYDPKEVKEYLLLQNLKDPRPLIHVCDRHGFIDELTQYLYSNDMYVFIPAFVQRMNPKACPKVIGALLDLNANEEKIKELLDNVVCPRDDPQFVDKLVEEVEKRNRLKLLKPFLESQKGTEDPFVHNGLAKIYVDTNNNPKNFLETNTHYDPAVVGKFCEARDPQLAFVAYRRAWGACDEQLIEVSNKNGFFKDQAKYLVERQDQNLWARVLDEEKNEHRRQLIDQVVASALPNSQSADEISSTVKAFMTAKLPNELIELLERIILHGNNEEFKTHKNLQNLLILTAIQDCPDRVMGYAKQLDNYDGPQVATHAVTKAKLYEEAFFIYKKFKKGPESINVLLNYIEDPIPRAIECAEYYELPEVWSILAKAQLGRGLVPDAIKSYMKADEAKDFAEVVQVAKAAGYHNELVPFIEMARKKLKDPVMDGEMVYIFAKTDRLAELEEFINGSHVAKLSDCGDTCFAEDLFHAAKILYNHVNNYAKLSVCLVKLGDFQAAVNAAQKAANMQTWKEVCFACVDAGEFRLAQLCGVHVLGNIDHLNSVINHYEHRGHFDEIIQLLEQGLNLDRASAAIYTQLGIMYCKYKEEQLFEHCKMYYSKLNIPQLLEACQENYHYKAAVFLYTHYDQHDMAADMMIQHSAVCWEHVLFKECMRNVSNAECYYKGITFYIEEHPSQLVDLLMELATLNVDASRVVNLVKPYGHLPLIMKYLLHVQSGNNFAVNEAVNNIHVQEENYKALSKSVQDFDQLDQVALAQQLENHELVEFRRIAAKLFKLNRRWERSIEISKKDQLWGDAMETVAASGDENMAEELLNFFVSAGQKECFAACLFTCYELIRADVVLEIAWRNGLMDFAMPFMIQCFRNFDSELRNLKGRFAAQDDAAKAQEEEEKKQLDQMNTVEAHTLGTSGVYAPMQQPLALAPPPGAFGYNQSMQAYPQQMQGMGGMQGGFYQ